MPKGKRKLGIEPLVMIVALPSLLMFLSALTILPKPIDHVVPNGLYKAFERIIVVPNRSQHVWGPSMAILP